MIEISVVIPVYNCTPCLEPLTLQLEKTLSAISGGHEIIYIDDCGPDAPWGTLLDLTKKNKNVKALKLSRNFGQHAAITAGLNRAKGRWTVVMDCDLQDSPEYIPKLYAEAQKGFDIVYTKRLERKHSLFRTIWAKLYMILIKAVDARIPDFSTGSFSMLSRKVVDQFITFRDVDRHYIHILGWMGFKSTAIEYTQDVRFSGKSAYTVRVLIKHALNGLFFQTTTFLYWIMYFGFFTSVAGALFTIYLIYARLTKSQPLGYTSLAVLILLLGGIIISCVGVCGIYIARIFDQVRARPLYIIEAQTITEE